MAYTITYIEGYKDAGKGKGAGENPYKEGDPRNRQWAEGHAAGAQDAEAMKTTRATDL